MIFESSTKFGTVVFHGNVKKVWPSLFVFLVLFFCFMAQLSVFSVFFVNSIP